MPDPPHLREDLLPRQHAPLRLYQAPEHVELRRRQLHRFAGARYLSSARVDDELAGAHHDLHVFAAQAVSPQHGLDPRQ